MAKLLTYPELTAMADGDGFVLVDVSDTTDDATGSTKYITAANLKVYLGKHYGEIKVESNATTTTFGGSSTDFSNKSQVTIFDTNGSSSGTTPDHTNDHITINNAGVYFVTVPSISFSGGISDTYSYAIFKNNGATQLTARTTRKLGTGGDVGAAANGGIVSLSATDTVEVWIQNEGDTSEITIQDISLCVFKIN